MIGGTSLLLLGGSRKTEDVDFAVTAAALDAFEEAAHKDPRFAKGNAADWTYSCQGEDIEGIQVPFEFLQMGGGFAPYIKVVKVAGGGFRASTGELARMKAKAYMSRCDDKDLDDFCFLLDKMEESGEGFEGVELDEEDLDSMAETAADCGRKYSEVLKELLKELLGRAGH